MVGLDVANGADNNVPATDIVLLLMEYQLQYQLQPLDSLYFCTPLIMFRSSVFFNYIVIVFKSVLFLIITITI